MEGEEGEGLGSKNVGRIQEHALRHKYQGRRLIFLRFNWIMYAYFHLGMMEQFWPLQPARAGVGFTSCMSE